MSHPFSEVFKKSRRTPRNLGKEDKSKRRKRNQVGQDGESKATAGEWMNPSIEIGLYALRN